MKKISFSWLFLFIFSSVFAQNFDDYFIDETLRLDYIFAGTSNESKVYLKGETKTHQWYGRKRNLSTTPIQGHAVLKVYDDKTNELIYVHPFGSLFQEWQTTKFSKSEQKSFENSFLIPFPKNKIHVVIEFYDIERKPHQVSDVEIDPSDILIKNHENKKANEFKILHKATVENPIRIAFVAEGYQSQEKELFYKYAEKAISHFLEHEVFSANRDKFEFIAVPLVSEDSGVSFPSRNIWKNTVLQSHFDTFYSERYLTTPEIHFLHENLENIPYQHIIILANTAIYGGGGILNSYSLTTTLDDKFDKVVVHEFGHSFAGLADEYFYPNDMLQKQSKHNVEPWEKNITTLVKFADKWQGKINDTTPIPTPRTEEYKGVVGAYEGLVGNGIYIPSQNCRMQTNDEVDFCIVCSDAIQEIIDFYTD